MNRHPPCTILHTEASMGWGGQEMRILKEMIGLSQRGWSMMLACDPDSGLFLQALKYNLPVIPVHFSYSNSLKVVSQIRRAIAEYEIDIVHTHSSVDSWLSGIAARLSGAALVRTRHLSTPIKGGWNAKLLYGSLADAVICTSQSAVDQIRGHLKKTKHIECIATGVDELALEHAARERQQARSEWGLQPSEIAIATACVLRSWKGLEEFLAAAQLLHKRSQVRFFIFGGGEGLKHYQQLAKEHYPNAKITFTGHLDPVSRSLSAMDIFCLLSTAHEGISQSTLQAAFLGKPLITTDIGGLTQVCIDQQTGFVVPPKNAQAVSRAMVALIENPQLRESMGQAGHQWVKKQFMLDQMLDQIERILETLVASRRP